MESFRLRRRAGRVVYAVLLACIGVALSFGLAAPAAAGSVPSFASPRSYATGFTPYSVAIGDLNGDRRPDLVTANGSPDNPGAATASVLLNRGAGRFEVRRNYRAGRIPIDVAIGDLDGDGQPDLALATADARSVSLLFNRGDGSFQPRHDYPTTECCPTSVAIGDLNGDGRPDLVTAISSSRANIVSVLFSRGGGRFENQRDYPTSCCPLSVVIGDLNGDGKPDLATANPDTNSVSVLFNNGDGSFQVKHDCRTGYDSGSIAIGDLNGDRWPDLVTAGYFEVSVHPNRGDGRFRARRGYRTGGAPAEAAIGDLNRDGKPDLATANGVDAGTVSVLLNRGDGSFRARFDYGTPRGGPFDVAIADVNGDSRLDLVTANGGADSVSVLLATTTGVCVVPNVKGKTLRDAKRAIARAQCRVAKVRRAYSKVVKKGRVISEKPTSRRVLPKRGKVNLVVSRGPMSARRGAASARLAALRIQPAILFAAVIPGQADSELFRVLPNGRHLRVLTRDRFDEDLPAWSRDRRRIAFTRYEPRAELCHTTCSSSIWTMAAAGGTTRRITHPPKAGGDWFDEGASWSPNGKSLVFERHNAGAGSLMTVARDGSHPRRIVALSTDFPQDAAWGPNGWIALASDAEAGGIFVVRPDGGGWRKVVGNPRETVLVSPVWDASGSRIAYAEPELGRIYIASAATGAILKTISVPPNFFTMRIAWSPDARTIAFNSRGRIFLIDVESAHLRRLGPTNTALSRLRKAEAPAWR